MCNVTKQKNTHVIRIPPERPPSKGMPDSGGAELSFWKILSVLHVSYMLQIASGVPKIKYLLSEFRILQWPESAEIKDRYDESDATDIVASTHRCDMMWRKYYFENWDSAAVYPQTPIRDLLPETGGRVFYTEVMTSLASTTFIWA